SESGGRRLQLVAERISAGARRQACERRQHGQTARKRALFGLVKPRWAATNPHVERFCRNPSVFTHVAAEALETVACDSNNREVVLAEHRDGRPERAQLAVEVSFPK